MYEILKHKTTQLQNCWRWYVARFWIESGEIKLFIGLKWS